jgi:hypothetical protein
MVTLFSNCVRLVQTWLCLRGFSLVLRLNFRNVNQEVGSHRDLGTCDTIIAHRMFQEVGNKPTKTNRNQRLLRWEFLSRHLNINHFVATAELTNFANTDLYSRLQVGYHRSVIYCRRQENTVPSRKCAVNDGHFTLKLPFCHVISKSAIVPIFRAYLLLLTIALPEQTNNVISVLPGFLVDRTPSSRLKILQMNSF